MDSFDDLLAPSRHILEENPFADPFAKRSNSPDPWASPFAVSQSSSATTATESPYEETGYGSSPRETSTQENTTSVIKDPLDSESLAHSEEDDNLDSGPPRIPGFKESVEPDSQFSETATIRPKDSENPIQDTLAGDAEPAASHIVEREVVNASSSQTPHLSVDNRPISPGSGDGDSASPLQSNPMGIDHSIANLSLGGEPTTGWMNERTAWGGESSSLVAPQPPLDDDSDDDKPIRQTLKVNIPQDGTSVSFYLCHVCTSDELLQ